MSTIKKEKVAEAILTAASATIPSPTSSVKNKLAGEFASQELGRAIGNLTKKPRASSHRAPGHTAPRGPSRGSSSRGRKR